LNIYRVKTEYIKTDSVPRFFSSCLADGYEGIILRHPENRYIYDRSQGMLKIKPIYDDEATLAGFNPTELDKNSETFGSLRLKLDSGIEFNCAGLTDSDRANLWNENPIGKRITFSYGALSSDGVPVFPRFKNVRWDL
jgi:DNA ligase 1